MFDISNRNQAPEPDRRVGNDANKSSGENIHIVYLASGSPLETLSAVFRTISDKDPEVSNYFIIDILKIQICQIKSDSFA